MSILEKFKNRNLFKWKKGRQEQGNYWKFLICQSKILKFDFYLLKFENTIVPWHNDPVPEGYKHHRFNFIIKRPISGGDTICLVDNKEIILNKRFYKFRPDVIKHSVNYINGKMYMITFGWLSK